MDVSISTALDLIAGDSTNLSLQQSDHDNGWHNRSSHDLILSRKDLEDLIRSSPVFRISSSNFNQATQASLIVAFAVLIVFGTAGNSLVCYVVLANRHMRTPRNLLIANLAVSDLVFCLFTQPFNLMKVSMPIWKLGTAMCKLVPMAAGTNVFVSTISITAIALDRFHLIVHPTETDILLKKSGSAIALLLIWILSLLMATPMLVFSTTRTVEPIAGLKLYEVCVENPDHHYAKASYSVASMIVQYLVPIAILSIAHAQICKKLRYRMTASRPTVSAAPPPPVPPPPPQSTDSDTPPPPPPPPPPSSKATSVVTVSDFRARRLQAEKMRKRKTNLLLVMIAFVFAVSWLPLNVVNVIADFEQTLILSFDKNGLVFAICHLLVLSSACANPVLYGWLNDNFRLEFLRALCSRCNCGGGGGGGGNGPSGGWRTRLFRCNRSSKENHELDRLKVKAQSPSVSDSARCFVETTVYTRDVEVKVEPCTVLSSDAALKTYGSTNL